MPTLYVENVPDSLYKALRKRARESRTSIAAEIISLLAQNVPTAEELQKRREFYKRMAELRARPIESSGGFPTAEQMISEDRDR
jgi:plasmid stability protein